MLPLGTNAPVFELPDTVSGKTVTLSQVKKDKGLVVMFICNHCPYVIHVQDEMVRIAKEFGTEGIGFVAISSNDIVNYPADSPELMREMALKLNFDFPYLYDETQEVAKAFQAECTPDFFVFESAGKLVYRGRMDGSTPGNGVEVTGEDLRKALKDMVTGKVISPDQLPSLGCNIKWKNN